MMTDKEKVQYAMKVSAWIGKMTVPNFFDNYRKLKVNVYKLLQASDLSSTSPIPDSDTQLIIQYQVSMTFVDDVRRALDFVRSGTFMKDAGDMTLEYRSLIPSKEQYASLIDRLSWRFDKDFMQQLENSRKEPFEPNTYTKREYYSITQAPLTGNKIQMELDKLQHQNSIYHIKDIQDAVEEAQVMMAHYGISYREENDDIANDTLKLYESLDQKGKTYVLIKEPMFGDEEDQRLAELYSEKRRQRVLFPSVDDCEEDDEEEFFGFDDDEDELDTEETDVFTYSAPGHLRNMGGMETSIEDVFPGLLEACGGDEDTAINVLTYMAEAQKDKSNKSVESAFTDDTIRFCPECGKKVIEGSKFCAYCGFRIKK